MHCPNLLLLRSMAADDVATDHIVNLLQLSPSKHAGNYNTRTALVDGLEECVKLSVGVPGNAYLLEIDDLFTRGSRPGRTDGDSEGGIFYVCSSDWSDGIRYHIFDTTNQIRH
jgi:hypothetical protein